MTQANTLELLMVDLINQERAAAGIAPLTIDDDLNTSSETHSAWMLDSDVFSHTGDGGSTATQRIQDAGYQLEGAWTTGENIGWQSERGAAGLEDDVRAIHESLMNSPGHRANILNPNYKEIGIGIEEGDFNAASGIFDAVMVTQNFGATEAADDEAQPAGEVEAVISEVPVTEDAPVDVVPAEAMPDEVIPADDPATEEVVDSACADDEMPDVASVTEEVVAGTDDQTPEVASVMEDPAEVPAEEPTDEMPATAPDATEAATAENAVVSREFVVTNGSITNTVTETAMSDANGMVTRTRTETQTNSEDTESVDFDSLSDVFDFEAFDLDMGDEGSEMSAFVFALDGPDGTVTTDDPAVAEELLASFFDDMPPAPGQDAMFI